MCLSRESLREICERIVEMPTSFLRMNIRLFYNLFGCVNKSIDISAEDVSTGDQRNIRGHDSGGHDFYLDNKR